MHMVGGRGGRVGKRMQPPYFAGCVSRASAVPRGSTRLGDASQLRGRCSLDPMGHPIRRSPARRSHRRGPELPHCSELVAAADDGTARCLPKQAPSCLQMPATTVTLIKSPFRRRYAHSDHWHLYYTGAAQPRGLAAADAGAARRFL